MFSVDYPITESPNRGLGAIGDIQFSENACDVSFYCVSADDQSSCDGIVVKALCKQEQYALFLFG